MKVHRYRQYATAFLILLFFTSFRRAETDKASTGSAGTARTRQAIADAGKSRSFSFEYNGLFYFRLSLEEKGAGSHLLLDLDVSKEI